MSDGRRPRTPGIAVTLALALGLLAGCGGSSPREQVVVDLDDLRTPVGCGDGFQAENDAATGSSSPGPTRIRNPETRTCTGSCNSTARPP